MEVKELNSIPVEGTNALLISSASSVVGAPKLSKYEKHPTKEGYLLFFNKDPNEAKKDLQMLTGSAPAPAKLLPSTPKPSNPSPPSPTSLSPTSNRKLLPKSSSNPNLNAHTTINVQRVAPSPPPHPSLSKLKKIWVVCNMYEVKYYNSKSDIEPIGFFDAVELRDAIVKPIQLKSEGPLFWFGICVPKKMVTFGGESQKEMDEWLLYLTIAKRALAAKVERLKMRFHSERAEIQRQRDEQKKWEEKRRHSDKIVPVQRKPKTTFKNKLANQWNSLISSNSGLVIGEPTFDRRSTLGTTEKNYLMQEFQAYKEKYKEER